jgi:hypothetical protein
MERLIAMLVKQKNDIMHMLQTKFIKVAAWRDTEWWKLWTQTMFGDISSIYALDGSKDVDLIDFYKTSKAKLMTIEKKLADCFFGKEMMDALRMSALLGFEDDNECRLYLASCIVAEIVKMYNGGIDRFHGTPFVDYIRKHKDSFPEWLESEFGQQYEEPVYYENKKDCGGFWFS